jgi:hypothetical protein
MTEPARAVTLAALEDEAERLAKLSEYECALQLQQSARRLDVPATTLERRVAVHRGEAVTVDAVELGRRLGKLVFMLGSDQAAVAAEAMGRALREAGRDWAYLAALVSQAEPAPAVSSDLQSFIRGGEKMLRAGGLRPNEHEFVTDMLERFSRGVEPTEKQAKWFAAIYQRYVR